MIAFSGAQVTSTFCRLLCVLKFPILSHVFTGRTVECPATPVPEVSTEPAQKQLPVSLLFWWRPLDKAELSDIWQSFILLVEALEEKQVQT